MAPIALRPTPAATAATPPSPSEPAPAPAPAPAAAVYILTAACFRSLARAFNPATRHVRPHPGDQATAIYSYRRATASSRSHAGDATEGLQADNSAARGAARPRVPRRMATGPGPGSGARGNRDDGYLWNPRHTRSVGRARHRGTT